jgi:endonuclease/exonuclease/phosphatase family metal-dependent hydrolase
MNYFDKLINRVQTGVLGAVAAIAYFTPGCGSDTSSGGAGPGAASTVGVGTAGMAGSGGGAGAGGVAGVAGTSTGGSGGEAPDAGSSDARLEASQGPADGANADGKTDAGSSDAAKEGGSGDSSLPPGTDLKVVTFNIRYANPADGVNVWANRRDLVYRLLRAEDADTAGLQEALITQLQDLDVGLPEFQRVGVGRDDGMTAGEFSAILYRASRFDVASSGTFWFSDTPDVPGSSTWGNASIRICTWARFVDKATGRAFYQFNVHLDNVSQPANEKSVQLLMKRVTERQVPTDPFVVTGDFNSGESNLVIHYMTGAASIGAVANPIPLVDSFRQLYPNATGVGTFHNFLGGTGGDKIDFIFMGPGENALAAAIVHTQENGRYSSDHYPVTAAIDILGWR